MDTLPDPASVGGLLVDCLRVVDQRADAVFAQIGLQRIAPGVADDVLVVDMAGIEGANRQYQPGIFEQVVVERGDFAAPGIFGVEMGQFGAQDGSLDFIEP